MEALLHKLAQTLDTLPVLLRTFSDDALRRPPEAPAADVETFSALGHVCHLRDIESDGYVVRIQRLRTEDRPLLVSLDGARLAAERSYDTADVEQALAAFGEARARSLEALRSVTPDEWDRGGQFEGYGPVTLRRLVEIMVEHDGGHLLAMSNLPRA